MPSWPSEFDRGICRLLRVSLLLIAFIHSVREEYVHPMRQVQKSACYQVLCPPRREALAAVELRLSIQVAALPTALRLYPVRQPIPDCPGWRPMPGRSLLNWKVSRIEPEDFPVGRRTGRDIWRSCRCTPFPGFARFPSITEELRRFSLRRAFLHGGTRLGDQPDSNFGPEEGRTKACRHQIGHGASWRTPTPTSAATVFTRSIPQ